MTRLHEEILWMEGGEPEPEPERKKAPARSERKRKDPEPEPESTQSGEDEYEDEASRVERAKEQYRLGDRSVSKKVRSGLPDDAAYDAKVENTLRGPDPHLFVQRLSPDPADVGRIELSQCPTYSALVAYLEQHQSYDGRETHYKVSMKNATTFRSVVHPKLSYNPQRRQQMAWASQQAQQGQSMNPWWPYPPGYPPPPGAVPPGYPPGYAPPGYPPGYAPPGAPQLGAPAQATAIVPQTPPFYMMQVPGAGGITPEMASLMQQAQAAAAAGNKEMTDLLGKMVLRMMESKLEAEKPGKLAAGHRIVQARNPATGQIENVIVSNTEAAGIGAPERPKTVAEQLAELQQQVQVLKQGGASLGMVDRSEIEKLKDEMRKEKEDKEKEDKDPYEFLPKKDDGSIDWDAPWWAIAGANAEKLAPILGPALGMGADVLKSMFDGFKAKAEANGKRIEEGQKAADAVERMAAAEERRAQAAERTAAALARARELGPEAVKSVQQAAGPPPEAPPPPPPPRLAEKAQVPSTEAPGAAVEDDLLP